MIKKKKKRKMKIMIKKKIKKRKGFKNNRSYILFPDGKKMEIFQKKQKWKKSLLNLIQKIIIIKI